MLKEIYRGYIANLEQKSQKVRLRKQWIYEWIEVFGGDIAKTINKVKLTKNQKDEIQEYWKSTYGKKIPLRWHRKFYAYSGCMDKKYFPDILHTTKLEPKMNPDRISKILQDKNLIELIFAKALNENDYIVIPKTVCGCSAGYFFDSDRTPISYERMVEKLKKLNGEYILKGAVGTSSGRDVMVLDLPNEKLETILADFGKDYIIQEKIEQHESYAAFHPKSVNTIRVMSYRTDDAIKTTPCVFRIGTGDGFVDNAHGGGMYIGVSDDGTIQKYGCRGSEARIDKHPDTQIVFENYKLPYLDRIISAVKKLHTCIPNLGMVNWDIAINKAGQVVLIEANMCCSGVWIFQNTGGGVFRGDTEYMINKIKK